MAFFGICSNWLSAISVGAPLSCGTNAILAFFVCGSMRTKTVLAMRVKEIWKWRSPRVVKKRGPVVATVSATGTQRARQSLRDVERFRKRIGLPSICWRQLA